jgi:hypothetical protein
MKANKIIIILSMIISKLSLVISGGFIGAMIESGFAPELLLGAILGIISFLGYEILADRVRKENE